MLYNKIALAAFAFLMLEKAASQQLIGLALLADQPQFALANPAFLPSKKWAISGPTGWADGHFSNGLAFDDFIEKDAAGQKRFNPQPILDGPADGLKTQAAWGTELFSVAYRRKNWAFSGGYGRRFGAAVAADRQFFEFFWRGNAAFVGQTVRLAPAFSAFGTQQASLGAAFESGKWQLGGRAKALFGGTALAQNLFEGAENFIDITTDADIYQLRLESSTAFFSTGGLLEISQDGTDFNVKTGKLTAKGPASDLAGFAFDLGATFRPTEKLTIGLSATDFLGRLTQKKSAKISANGTAQFDGAEFPATAVLNAEDLDFSSQLDSVLTAIGFRAAAVGDRSVDRQQTFLPQKFMATARFSPSEKWEFGAAAFLQGAQILGSSSALAVSARRFWFEKKLSLAATPVFSSVSGVDFGASLTARMGFLSLFAASDNVFSAFQPFKTDRANFALGLSASF